MRLSASSAPFVPERILSSSQTWPDAIAARSGDRLLTYQQLDVDARGIAARLRAVGVSAGDRVAIVLPRSVDLVSSIHAVWMLGASYVPIDISQPAARVTELISVAGVTAAISSGDGHAGLTEVTTIHIDRPDAAVLPISRVSETSPDAEAYVIFTSGSSGRPKGVPISHSNLRTSLAARQQWYEHPVATYLLVSSAGFDSSIAGLFWTLADGGELVLPTEDEVHDVDALVRLIADNAVTHTLMVPSLYGAVLQRGSTGAHLSTLSTVIVAGEACPPSLVAAHVAADGGATLVNEYGPTEVTVWSTAHRCAPGDAEAHAVPIGGPIAGVTAEVVDELGLAVPVDTAGELWLSGESVAHGYITDDEADRFIHDRGPARTYRTGDLVIRRANGSIDFLGRIDAQLSVGGVRIEPAEIEHALSSIDGVRACLVGVRDAQLLAWVEHDNSDVEGARLRAQCAEVLPATHVPTRVVVVDELPRNANGKLDRKRLSELPSRAVQVEPHAPVHAADSLDPVVVRVTEVFSASFDDAPIEFDTDFFDAGGDSLRAVALVTLLEAEFGRRVGIGELIDAPTPLQLATRLVESDGRDSESYAGDGQASVSDRSSAFSDHARHSDLIEVLRSAGTETPLVVLPPGGGNLLRYAPLVRAMRNDVPVIGIRLPGADARSEIVDSISDQASVMLDALDTALESGPYRLLGWSTGGLLAWEIARLLQERGDEVAEVVLVDTVMAGLRVDDSGTIADKYREMLRNDGAKAAATEGVSRLRERASFAIARRRYRTARESGQAPTQQDAERQLGPVIRRAALGYTPTPLDLPVTYVSASESDNAVTLDPWSELQGDLSFAVVEIDGVHFQPEERCIIGVNRAGILTQSLDLS